VSAHRKVGIPSRDFSISAQTCHHLWICDEDAIFPTRSTKEAGCPKVDP
jgi:hypothetical protein